MAIISKHSKEIRSVFGLLGTQENDLSASLGWALAQCPVLLARIVQLVCGERPTAEQRANAAIRLQEHGGKDGGFTDVELLVPGLLFAVIEMKRGWGVPGAEQLEKYAVRKEFENSAFRNRSIVTLSESSEEFANQFLPTKAGKQIPVRHMPWKLVIQETKASLADSNNHEKRLLRELLQYLDTATTMRRIDTNWVLVVSLSDGQMPGWDLTFRQIADERHRYFHPVGHRWPHEPLNYIALRSGGKLQSIHHIEDYTVSKDPNPFFPEANGGMFDVEHYIYSLGPAIVPSHVVRNGPRVNRSGRVWCMLDTLLTCSTITEAMELSKKRESKND